MLTALNNLLLLFLVSMTVKLLPDVYIEKLIIIVANALEVSRHLEFYLTWGQALLSRASALQINSTALLSLQRSIQRKYDQLARM